MAAAKSGNKPYKRKTNTPKSGKTYTSQGGKARVVHTRSAQPSKRPKVKSGQPGRKATVLKRSMLKPANKRYGK